VATAVQSQRRRESDVERRLLRALWKEPDLLGAARGELRVEDFEDGSARALAALWWEHGVVMPSEEGADGAATLARELASRGRTIRTIARRCSVPSAGSPCVGCSESCVHDRRGWQPRAAATPSG
jgi:hypothetical protein